MEPKAMIPRRILVVDDEPRVLQLIRIHLERKGYVIETAKHGVEALAKIRVTLPDMVISDVMMPEMDGVELLTILRNEATTNGLPVLMLTARSPIADYEEPEGVWCANGGLHNTYYLLKPFNPKHLVEWIYQYFMETGRAVL